MAAEETEKPRQAVARKKPVPKKKTVPKKRTPAKKKAAPSARKPKSAKLPPGTTMTEALGETFLMDLISDWQENGGGVIETCRTTKPDAYLKLVATYAPKEFTKTLQPFEGMSDDDLKHRLESALEKIRALGVDQST